MFDIGWSELLVIGAVALIAIGPKELPGVLRSVGHWMGKIRRMASEFQGQFQEALREAEMADLKKHADDLNSVTKSLTSGLDPSDMLRDFGNETKPAAETAAAEPASPEPDAPPVSLDPPAAQEPHEPATIVAAGSPEVVPAPAQDPTLLPAAKEGT